MVWDTIHGRDPAQPAVEEWGGISYALSALDATLPEGVTVQKREGGGRTFLFVHNLKAVEQAVDLPRGRFADVSAGKDVSGRLALPAYGTFVLERL